MNTQFNEEQIRAYASAFTAGDAIWCSGEWRELSKSSRTQGLTCVSPNRYVIHCHDGEVAISGFREEENPYRVTTLEHYELQGGEKLVWLGESNELNGKEFGKVYTRTRNDRYNGEWYDDGIFTYPIGSEHYKYWGVIPSYEQVQKQKLEIDSSDLSLNINLTIEELDIFMSIHSLVYDIIPYCELLNKIDKEKGRKLIQDLSAFTQACESINKQRNEYTRQLLKKEWRE